MGVLHSIDNAREENVGPHGVKAHALNAALTRAEGALEWLRARHAGGGLPLLRLPEMRGDLEDIRDTARRLADRATDIVILGTGGSSLGGQTLAQLAGFKGVVPGRSSIVFERFVRPNNGLFGFGLAAGASMKECSEHFRGRGELARQSRP